MDRLDRLKQTPPPFATTRFPSLDIPADSGRPPATGKDACQLVPPCNLGRHSHNPLQTGSSTLGEYHLTEEGLKHDLSALKKGDIYQRSDFLFRARAWYKAEIDRQTHLERVKAEEQAETHRSILLKPRPVNPPPIAGGNSFAPAGDASASSSRRPRSHRRRPSTQTAPTRIQPPRAAKRKTSSSQSPAPRRAKKVKTSEASTPTAQTPSIEPPPDPVVAPKETPETKGDYVLDYYDFARHKPFVATREGNSSPFEYVHPQGEAAYFITRLTRVVDARADELMECRKRRGSTGASPSEQSRWTCALGRKYKVEEDFVSAVKGSPVEGRARMAMVVAGDDDEGSLGEKAVVVPDDNSEEEREFELDVEVDLVRQREEEEEEELEPEFEREFERDWAVDQKGNEMMDDEVSEPGFQEELFSDEMEEDEEDQTAKVEEVQGEETQPVARTADVTEQLGENGEEEMMKETTEVTNPFGPTQPPRSDGPQEKASEMAAATSPREPRDPLVDQPVEDLALKRPEEPTKETTQAQGTREETPRAELQASQPLQAESEAANQNLSAKDRHKIIEKELFGYEEGDSDAEGFWDEAGQAEGIISEVPSPSPPTSLGGRDSAAGGVSPEKESEAATPGAADEAGGDVDVVDYNEDDGKDTAGDGGQRASAIIETIEIDEVEEVVEVLDATVQVREEVVDPSAEEKAEEELKSEGILDVKMGDGDKDVKPKDDRREGNEHVMSGSLVPNEGGIPFPVLKEEPVLVEGTREADERDDKAEVKADLTEAATQAAVDDVERFSDIYASDNDAPKEESTAVKEYEVPDSESQNHTRGRRFSVYVPEVEMRDNGQGAEDLKEEDKIIKDEPATHAETARNEEIHMAEYDDDAASVEKHVPRDIIDVGHIGQEAHAGYESDVELEPNDQPEVIEQDSGVDVEKGPLSGEHQPADDIEMAGATDKADEAGNAQDQEEIATEVNIETKRLELADKNSLPKDYQKREATVPEATMDVSPTLGKWVPETKTSKDSILEDLIATHLELSGLKFAVDVCGIISGDEKEALIVMI
ncbi:hypothetical protein OQA88_8213 [Cercophora sp. LCS_1]